MLLLLHSVFLGLSLYALLSTLWFLSNSRWLEGRDLIPQSMYSALSEGLVDSLLRLPTALTTSCLSNRGLFPQQGSKVVLFSAIEPSSPSRLSVYHITKEFGWASMGGMGSVVTALALGQAQSNCRVTVVLPFYKFIQDHPPHQDDRQPEGKGHFRKVKTLTLKVLDCFSPLRRFLPRCSFAGYSFASRSQSDFSSSTLTAARLSSTIAADSIHVPFDVYETFYPSSTQEPRVRVWLISPSTQFPFSAAFQVSQLKDMYRSGSEPWLEQEWQDLYFNKAVAETLQAAAEQHSLHSDSVTTTQAAVVHVHGATNGMVMHFFPAEHLSLFRWVYTLHDYSDEVMYSLSEAHVQAFLPPPTSLLFKRCKEASMAPQDYFQARCVAVQGAACSCLRRRIYLSGLNIFVSNATTMVSRSVAKEILLGRLSFSFQESVIDFIREKALGRRFFGITNGISFERLNPFNHPQLMEHDLLFPLEKRTQEWIFGPQFGTTLHRTQESTAEASVKLQAKQLLCSTFHLFTSTSSCTRRLFLYVGRFQRQKGFQEVLEVIPTLLEHEANLIVMGQPHNVPHEPARQWAAKHPDRIRVIETQEEQERLGVLIRMAADFVFIPSWMESFGLVAVEALLFGSLPVSSGVGGLKEFLKPLKNGKGSFGGDGDSPAWMGNAILFEPRNVESMKAALILALKTLDPLHSPESEQALRRQLVLHALDLGWKGSLQTSRLSTSSSSSSPLNDYFIVYCTLLHGCCDG